MRARQQILLDLSTYLLSDLPICLPMHVPIHLATSPSNPLTHLSTHPTSTFPSIYFIHQFISVIHPKVHPSTCSSISLSTPSIHLITNQLILPPISIHYPSVHLFYTCTYSWVFAFSQLYNENVVKAHCGLLHVVPSEAIMLIKSIWSIDQREFWRVCSSVRPFPLLKEESLGQLKVHHVSISHTIQAWTSM